MGEYNTNMYTSKGHTSMLALIKLSIMLHVHCAMYKLDNQNTNWTSPNYNNKPHRSTTKTIKCTHTLLPILLVCSKECV